MIKPGDRLEVFTGEAGRLYGSLLAVFVPRGATGHLVELGTRFEGACLIELDRELPGLVERRVYLPFQCIALT